MSEEKSIIDKEFIQRSTTEAFCEDVQGISTCVSVNGQSACEQEDVNVPSFDFCGGNFKPKLSSEVKECRIKLNEEGHIALPDDMMKMLGGEDTASFRVVNRGNRIEIYPNIHSLGKVYIEVTSRCNLSCQTCVRNSWDEPMGNMDIGTFDMLVDQLKDFKAVQSVMFGGFGEPTFHKDILYMISRVKSLGLKAEMVTNGTLLNKGMLEGFIEKGLDSLWVSFDGTSSNSFDDIREGASFDAVVKNLKLLKKMNAESVHKIKVGIAFVVMKRNIHELKNVGNLAIRVGAEMVSVSNVLPYCSDMLDQMVCDTVVLGSHQSDKYTSIPISIPLIDSKELLKETFNEFFENNKNIFIMRNNIVPETPSCRFIKERCTFIRWDGQVSPCMGLLHSYKTYFNADRSEREVTSYSLGSIREKSLKEIWDSQEYHDFRERVDSFSFSPCIRCGPCKFAGKNHEDCYGNDFPTCGGCLWAQGVIQCP